MLRVPSMAPVIRGPWDSLTSALPCSQAATAYAPGTDLMPWVSIWPLQEQEMTFVAGLTARLCSGRKRRGYLRWSFGRWG